MSQSRKDPTTSEQSEAIQQLRMKSISLHGSLKEKEKSRDKPTPSLDRIEYQVMRLVHQIRELQETVNALQDAEEF